MEAINMYCDKCCGNHSGFSGQAMSRYTCKKCGIKLRVVINLENGFSQPPIQVIIKLLKVLDITFEELIDFSNIQEIKHSTIHHIVRNRR